MCWYGMCHSWGAFFAQKINFRVSIWQDHKWINILGWKNNYLEKCPTSLFFLVIIPNSFIRSFTFHGDFCKLLSCSGWAGKQGIGRVGLIKVAIFQKSRQPSLSKSSNTNVTKMLIGKINKFDNRFDCALFHGDFCKSLSCAGWAGNKE